MSKNRASHRSAWGVQTLFMALMMMSAIAAAADDAPVDDPRQWLERMNQALTTRNYDGVFAHVQGGKVEMLRIIHRVKDGRVSERLVSLDGSGREFIRTNGELVCYLPDKRQVIVEKRSDRNPLLGNFPASDKASTQFYDVKEMKRTRLFRRDVRVISVTPKDQFRYGYRLWIDEQTGMPLRTQLCDSKGREIEQLVLAEDKPLRINTNIPDSAFLPEVSTEGFEWLRAEPNVRQAAVSGEGPRWAADKLPPGFRITLRSAQVMPGATGPVDHLVFSDGLASVSVFVEMLKRRNGSASAAGDETPERAPSPVTRPATGVATIGSTSAFSMVIEGRKVTAVGEVPPETVKSIANSFRAPAPLTLQGPPQR